jgi:rare lipoprotein A
MRYVLAHSLVVLAVVTSLGAAQRPKSSNESKAKASTVKKNSSSPAVQRSKPYQVGRASWYGKHFHGRKTASGEPYDMFQFTAAHPALPLGTTVKVTNLRNRRWVVVRVNDRGPVPKSRIIDLSYGAAQILGLRAGGVESVRLDIVPPDRIDIAQARVSGMP